MKNTRCNLAAKSGITLLCCLFFFLVSSAFAGSSAGSIKILRVVDGDTIEVVYQGKKEHVRLIGLDTPETKHPTKPVEPYGPEASDFTKKSLTGKQVWLEFDVTLRDKYNRLLAYVWMVEPPVTPTDADIRANMFNAHLLLQGYARLLTIPPNVRYVDYFKMYQTEGREAYRGLWGLAPAKQTEQKPSAPAVTPRYVGNKSSMIFHLPSCLGAAAMSDKNRVLIESRDTAIKEGYKPHKECNP